MKVIVRKMSSDELKHHGIKGQKWGVRRYENPDGTLTEEGRARYRKDAERARKEIGDASRNPDTGMGTGQAASYLRLGSKNKPYRELAKVVSKASRRAGSDYTKSVFGKGNRGKAALEYADAIASTSIQYINENFSKEDRDKAKAFVYAQFVQLQDRAIRLKFGQINN